MKRIITFALTILMVSAILFTTIIPFSAATALDPSKKVSFDVSCDKPGYEFNVYKVASLVTSTSPSYEVKYTSDISSISDSIINGNSKTMLTALDSIETMPVAVVGTVNSTTESTKAFSNLDQGIYYVRAVNFPAGVKEVTNSVFSLPYYDKTKGWTYTIETINLASKVIDDVPEIKKEITNSTKSNVNFTDVSLGDSVNFDITASTAGSKMFKLKEYVITDDMNKGLTLTDSSITVKLTDKDNKTTATLSSSDFTLTKVKSTLGEDSQFKISINSSVLNDTKFYEAANVVVSYSAVLNKYATTLITGNPNTVTTLKYTNKTNVSAEIEGNTVYVYTYKVQVNKTGESGQALQGAKFAIYKTENDAKNETNPLAEGTSDQNGKVVLQNSKKEEILLQSGKYYIKELSAPDGYNRYTSVIPVEIKAEYNDTIVNNTYIKSAPENGLVTVSVKNTKTILPQTGGTGTIFIYILSGMSLAAAITLFIKRKTSKS